MIARYLQLLMKCISRRSWIEKGMTAHKTFNLIDIVVIELWCNTGIHHVRFTVKHCHQLPVVMNIQRQNVRRLHPAKSQYFQTAGAYFSFRGLKRLKYSWTISSEWDAGIPSCRGMQQICTGGRMKIRPTNTKILSRSVNIKPPWEWSLHRVPCSIQ